jgi:hypothetical protein
VRQWNRFFFEPRSTSPAALVRIAWGLLVATWAISLLPDVDPFLTEGALRYDRTPAEGAWNSLNLLDWSHAPLAACLVLVLTGLLTAAGAWTTASAAVSLVLLVSLQRTNSVVLNSGDLLVRLVGLGVVLSPAGRLLSIDEWRRQRRSGASSVPARAPFGIRLLQLWVAIGYFLSGWLKVQGDAWPDGVAVGYALRIEDLQRVTPPEWLFASEGVIAFLTWSTLVLEFGFVFLVWNRRLRPWVLGAGVLFHLGIDLWLDVGFFSWAMFAAYLAFLPPEVADRVVDRLRRALVWRRGPAGPGAPVSDGDADDRATPGAPPRPADRAASGDPLLR